MKLKALVAVLMGTALLACEGTVDPDRDLARNIIVIRGQDQTVPINGVAQPIEVEVQDARGRPVRGSPLYWTLEHKERGRIGYIVRANAESDREGRADATVQVDSVRGEYLVNVWANRYVNEAGDSVWVEATVRLFAN